MAIQRAIIDMSGRKGLSPKWFGDVNRHGYTGALEAGDPNLRYLANDGYMVSGVFNPVTKYGYLSPSSDTFLATTLSSGTAVSKTIPVSLVDDGSKDIWFACNNSHIYFSNQFYNSALTDSVTVSSALQALNTFTDSCVYQLNGNQTLFFAWVGSSNGYISTLSPSDSSGASFNENWSQADVTNPLVFTGTTKTLRLVTSNDSFLYVLDRDKIHRIDGTTVGGTNGTLYQNIFQGQGGTVFNLGVEYKNKLYISVRKKPVQDDPTDVTTSSSGSSQDIDVMGVYIWNKQSNFYNSSDYVHLPGVDDIRAMWVAPGGILRIITVEASGECAIRTFDGTNFKVTQMLPNGAAPSTPKCLKNHGLFTYWLGNDGFLYGFGSDIPGETEFLFSPGQVISNGQGTLIGGSLACTSTPLGDASPSGYKPTDVFWVTYATTTSNGFIKTFYPYAYDTIATSNNIARHIGKVYTPVKLLPTLSTVKHINIVMQPIPNLSTPTQVEAIVKFYFNQSATSSYSKNITRADISKGYISIEINKPYVNSIQMSIEHNTNSNIGVADFAPAYAELIYDTTTTIK